MTWLCRGRDLRADARPGVMGIVNVTPDSFSDGGRFLAPDAAIAHGRALLAEGADLLDVGAESTRPGSDPVPPAEQVRRLAPVLEGLRGAPLSVDTASAEVAAFALERGAIVVNDVTALADPAMAGVIARAGAGVVLMHARGTPRTMQDDPRYDDVAGEVEAFLAARLAAATAAGISPEAVALDPGIGFGKTADHNWALLAAIPRLAALGRPVVIGASRKRFLGAVAGADDPPERRLEASLAVAALAARDGAAVLRVHDVAATVRAVRAADAVRAAAGVGTRART